MAKTIIFFISRIVSYRDISFFIEVQECPFHVPDFPHRPSAAPHGRSRHRCPLCGWCGPAQSRSCCCHPGSTGREGTVETASRQCNDREQWREEKIKRVLE